LDAENARRVASAQHDQRHGAGAVRIVCSRFSTTENAMYTLYYAPGSASMVVHLALLELGVAHELRRVDLEAGAQRDPDYLRLNPNGVVPTLLIDGQPYFESSALAFVLAERHSDRGLAPAPGAATRTAYLQWMFHLANTLQPAFRLWFYPSDLGEADPSAVKAAARSRIESTWDRLDAQLAAGGPYLLGDAISVLDLYATMLMRWSRNMPRPATQWTNLRALADRVRSRDSFKRLYEVEGLTEWA
jgi:glutathione S-transferase